MEIISIIALIWLLFLQGKVNSLEVLISKLGKTSDSPKESENSESGTLSVEVPTQTA